MDVKEKLGQHHRTATEMSIFEQIFPIVLIKYSILI